MVTLLKPEKRGSACCGIDGATGPNMACEACGLPVASRIDDCSLWQAVWLAPDAVHRLPLDGADTAPLSWEKLTAQGKSTPPFEPIARWGSRMDLNRWWAWRREGAWEEALASAVFCA